MVHGAWMLCSYQCMCMLTEALLWSAPLAAADGSRCHPQAPPVGTPNCATDNSVQDGVHSRMQHEEGDKGKVHHLTKLNTKQGEDEADLMGNRHNNNTVL